MCGVDLPDEEGGGKGGTIEGSGRVEIIQSTSEAKSRAGSAFVEERMASEADVS